MFKKILVLKNASGKKFCVLKQEIELLAVLYFFTRYNFVFICFFSVVLHLTLL